MTSSLVSSQNLIESGSKSALEPVRLKHAFMSAITRASLKEVDRLAPLLDWSLFDAEENPIYKALAWDLWKPVNEHNFDNLNRRMVANAVFEEYNFSGFQVESSGGWGVSNDGEDRSTHIKNIFSYPIAEDGFVDESKDTVQLILVVTFQHDDHCLHEVGCVGPKGSEMGELGGGNFDDFHTDKVICRRPEKMQKYLEHIVHLCESNGRSDLISLSPDSENRSITDSIFYRAAQTDQKWLMTKMLDQGIDLDRVVPSTEKFTLANVIKDDFGDEVMNFLRSHLALRAAQRAVAEIKGNNSDAFKSSFKPAKAPG